MTLILRIRCDGVVKKAPRVSVKIGLTFSSKLRILIAGVSAYKKHVKIICEVAKKRLMLNATLSIILIYLVVPGQCGDAEAIRLFAAQKRSKISHGIYAPTSICIGKCGALFWCTAGETDMTIYCENNQQRGNLYVTILYFIDLKDMLKTHSKPYDNKHLFYDVFCKIKIHIQTEFRT